MVTLKRIAHPSAVVFVVATMIIATPTHTQSNEPEVRAVIDHLFDSMHTGDSVMVRGVLHEEAFIVRAGSQGSNVGMIDGIVKVVSTWCDEIW